MTRRKERIYMFNEARHVVELARKGQRKKRCHEPVTPNSNCRPFSLAAVRVSDAGVTSLRRH